MMIDRAAVEAMSPLDQKNWYRQTQAECRQVFDAADKWLQRTNRVSYGYKERYRRLARELRPGDDAPTYETTKTWADAVGKLRQAAIDRSTSSQRKFTPGVQPEYCTQGLNKFLDYCGLEQVMY